MQLNYIWQIKTLSLYEELWIYWAYGTAKKDYFRFTMIDWWYICFLFWVFIVKRLINIIPRSSDLGQHLKTELYLIYIIHVIVLVSACFSVSFFLCFLLNKNVKWCHLEWNTGIELFCSWLWKKQGCCFFKKENIFTKSSSPSLFHLVITS